MRQELAGLTMVRPALHVRFAQGSFSVAPFNVQDAAIFTVETRPAKHFEAVPIPGDPAKGSTGVESTGTLVRRRRSARSSANSQESTARDGGQTRTRARTKAPKLALADIGERAAS